MGRRICSLLLALLLLAGAAAPARCAGQLTVICETGEEAGVISLGLEGLDGSAVYGVQLELVLAGEYDRCTFTPGSRAAYSPDCLVESRRGGTTVTIYLTSRTALSADGKLDMGKLDLGVDEIISWDALPETASVTLLDGQLRPMGLSGNLPVTATAPSGTGHTPSGPGTEPAQPSTQPEPQLPADVPPFTDVAAGAWYYGAVQYVYARGIMNGTEPDRFSPDQSTSRAMIVTMLHRLEGSPAARPAAFRDVSAGAYYAAPVAWAAANGIVTGTGDGLFSPDAPITREQLAAILYRYAQAKGLDVSAQADLGKFPDASRVSAYAEAPMRWAVATGLITGSDGQLLPGGQAVRAQVATIFQRLCVNQLGMV